MSDSLCIIAPDNQEDNNTSKRVGRFKPGQSGNPKGRPKGKTLATIMREALNDVMLNGKPMPGGVTVAEALVQVMIVNAMNGDSSLVKEIFNRIDGRVVERVEIRNMSTLSDEELQSIAERDCGGDSGNSEESGEEETR